MEDSSEPCDVEREREMGLNSLDTPFLFVNYSSIKLGERVK
jgi:hypothetical protein